MVYISETDGKDFGNYQMLLNLFEYLRDGDINPKEVFKNLARFKSDSSEIKIREKKINKSKKYNKQCYRLFWFTWNNYWFF